jgi:hypothetical protein
MTKEICKNCDKYEKKGCEHVKPNDPACAAYEVKKEEKNEN